MINVQPHITKLELLKKYMDIWLEEKYYFRIRVEALKRGLLLPKPNELPDFETWYNSYYCAANN